MKWLMRILGGLVALLVLAVALVYVVSSVKVAKSYDVQAEAITIPDDEEAIARGEYLATGIADCTNCHGENLGGNLMIDEFVVGKLYGANLTSGKGGVGSVYTDEDWVRAIRHGVGKDNKGLIIMPAKEFYRLNDDDLAAIIAYVKSMPPVDNEIPDPSIGPLIRTFYALGQVDLISAAVIPHEDARPEAVEPGVTAEYGGYLVSFSCVGCHRDDLTGGPMVGAPPDWPEPSDLTPGGALPRYDLETFTRLLRTGETYAGKFVDSEYMPWENTKILTDEDIEAIWLYLNTLSG